MLTIFYGIKECYLDVTTKALTQCVDNNILTIPSGDHARANLFTDPLYGILKHIYIKLDTSDNKIDKIYNHNECPSIDVSFLDINSYVHEYNSNHQNQLNPSQKLQEIHNKLIFKHGSLSSEYPEQLMSVMFLKGHECVLEIGGNIGRNSLTIATLLNNQNNLVVLESDINIAKQLKENKRINNYIFHIVPKALSYKKLIQKDWITLPSDILLEGYKPVDIITFEELECKYNLKFDTIVADCEGALYYILKDNPDILNNIDLILMENDYWDIIHKHYVDALLLDKGFHRVYHQGGGWGPCSGFFYETWKK